MGSIPKIYHTLEKREMTLFEYETYLANHPHRKSLRSIICVECGDEILYCNGEVNGSYFKHIPTSEGHSYCSLYHEGKESTSCESFVRRKLLNETDISLNFELRCFEGKWQSFISFPPFRREELDDNTKNNSCLSLEYNGVCRNVIPLDNAHFNVGEMKKIQLKGFPDQIRIKVSGATTTHDISYFIDGFIPNKQIYTPLLSQEYSPNGSSEIDLRRLRTFACKKVSGNIYPGKHYLIFSRDSYDSSFFALQPGDLIIHKFTFYTDEGFRYIAYDIMFNGVNERTEAFCENRCCQLLDKEDAIILWPPVVSIGDYKYYKDSSTNMFISFENEFKTMDLVSYGTKFLFFKVKNLNSNSFYVMLNKDLNPKKEVAYFERKECQKLSLEEENNYYLFQNKVLIRKIKDRSFSLKKNSSILSLKGRFERITFRPPSDTMSLNHENLLTIIRYSRAFEKLSNEELVFLRNKYKNDNLVNTYLDICEVNGSIKREAKGVLLEEKI